MVLIGLIDSSDLCLLTLTPDAFDKLRLPAQNINLKTQDNCLVFLNVTVAK